MRQDVGVGIKAVVVFNFFYNRKLGSDNLTISSLSISENGTDNLSDDEP